MGSSKKWIMMGMSIVVIPLGKAVLKKLMGKVTEKLEEDSPSEEEEAQAVYS